MQNNWESNDGLSWSSYFGDNNYTGEPSSTANFIWSEILSLANPYLEWILLTVYGVSKLSCFPAVRVSVKDINIFDRHMPTSICHHLWKTLNTKSTRRHGDWVQGGGQFRSAAFASISDCTGMTTALSVISAFRDHFPSQEALEAISVVISLLKQQNHHF